MLVFLPTRCKPLTLIVFLLLICFTSLPAVAQRPTKQWDWTLGGSSADRFACVRQTKDGGYILGGSSISPLSNSKSEPSRGLTDYWVVKLDALGQKQWDRTFGGKSVDELVAIEQTTDGGYILGGWSLSDKSGDKTDPMQDLQAGDYWIIKLDANGIKQWDHTYGGQSIDHLASLQQTADGGYILGGTSSSGISGDKTQPNRSRLGTREAGDYWVVKVDASGVKQWDRTYGGQDNEEFIGIHQTADGGYVMGGFSDSDASGEKTENNKNDSSPSRSADYWILKVDAAGRKQWDRTLGGSDDDRLRCLQQTAEGGYVVGGFSFSSSSKDKTQSAKGEHDYWIIKLDAQGIKQWDRTVGGTQSDALGSLQQTTDGGYILGGISNSGATGDRTHPNRSPNGDYWVVKLDTQGHQQWDLAYGGDSGDILNSVRQTLDGGYILGGSSHSGLSGDKTQPNFDPNGTSDFWIIKLSGPSSVRISGDSLLCNGGQGLLTAVGSTPGATYTWSTGATSATLPINQPGTYSVVASFSSELTSTASYVVRAFTPSVAIMGDSVLCVGQAKKLTAVAPSAIRYEWNTGATTAQIYITQPGDYAITAFFAGGCSRTAQWRVRAGVAPAAFSLGSDTTICEGTTLMLQAPLLADLSRQYQWSDGSTGSSLVVSQAGTYSLQVVTQCGTQTASRQVLTQLCIVAPNIITPNGDGRNECFVIQGVVGSDWILDIYSRWGTKVFTTQSYQNNWGPEALVGTYYYTLRHAANTTRVYKGWLDVVK